MFIPFLWGRKFFILYRMVGETQRGVLSPDYFEPSSFPSDSQSAVNISTRDIRSSLGWVKWEGILAHPSGFMGCWMYRAWFRSHHFPALLPLWSPTVSGLWAPGCSARLRTAESSLGSRLAEVGPACRRRWNRTGKLAPGQGTEAAAHGQHSWCSSFQRPPAGSPGLLTSAELAGSMLSEKKVGICSWPGSLGPAGGMPSLSSPLLQAIPWLRAQAGRQSRENRLWLSCVRWAEETAARHRDKVPSRLYFTSKEADVILAHGWCGRGSTDFTVRHSDPASHLPNPIKVSLFSASFSWAKE